jgi:hypothetical protein
VCIENVVNGALNRPERLMKGERGCFQIKTRVHKNIQARQSNRVRRVDHISPRLFKQHASVCAAAANEEKQTGSFIFNGISDLSFHTSCERDKRI